MRIKIIKGNYWNDPIIKRKFFIGKNDKQETVIRIITPFFIIGIFI